MQRRTLNKLFREFFSAQSPVYEENPSEQKNIISCLLKAIQEKKRPHVKIDEDRNYHYGNKKIDKARQLCLEISNPYGSGSWHDRANVEVSFHEENGKHALYITPTNSDNGFHFSGQATDLFAFIDLVLEQYQEIKNRATKTTKIKSLKKGAVSAKIKEIAKNKQFNFYLKEFQNKLKLLIQIGEKGVVSVDILFSRFQQEIIKIEGIVDAARTLYDSGIVANLNFKGQTNDHLFRYFTKYTDI